MDITVWKALLVLCAIIGGISGLYSLHEKKKAIGFQIVIVIAIIFSIIIVFFPKLAVRIFTDNNNEANVEQTQTSPNQSNAVDTGTTVGIENDTDVATQTPASIQPNIEKERVPVKTERIEATGISGYKLEKEWALEEAEENAKKKLLNRLSKSSITYDIEKSTVDFFDGDGWKATVVIFTYK